MKESVEVVERRHLVLEAIQLLHEVPERVRVQHEPRARHDVGPVAGLVLLQQKESLVLLGQQPLQGQVDALRVTLAQAASCRANSVSCATSASCVSTATEMRAAA